MAEPLSDLLHRYGVDEQAVADAVERRLSAAGAAALTADEERLLQLGGLRLDDSTALSLAAARDIVADQVALFARSRSTRDVAADLRVSESRVRHRIADGALYALRGHGRVLLPEWQFGPEGEPLPGLGRVLGALSGAEHPLTVESFFRSPQPDLLSPTGAPMTPRDWLLSGGDPEAVADLLAGDVF